MPGLFVESMAPVFNTVGDEMEHGWTGYRSKYIHTVGVTGKVKFVMNHTSRYTGIFEGADYGFIRMSAAAEPDPSVKNLAPGFGLKFLRDGIDSANLVAMYSVDGQDTWNFFANDFTNHVAATTAPSTLAVATKFATQTSWVQEVGLSDFARYTSKGEDRSDRLNFPYMLKFLPTDAVKNLFSDDYEGLFTDQLATIPAGTVLYDVKAQDKPIGLDGKE